MINIRERIELIQNLLGLESVQGATYAALECRSTIEAMCYERFAASNKHLSTADLKKWQPRDVVRQVLEEANAEAAGQLILMVARPQEAKDVGKVDPEDLEYVEIGRQAELRYIELAKLHHALSNVALHIKIPDAGETLRIYGDKNKIEEKVLETLRELEAATSGTMLMSSMKSDCSFECFCGSTIKRKAAMLHDGQVVCCNRPECKESYAVSLDGPDVYFTRRSHSLNCICKEQIDVPERMVRELKLGDHLVAECHTCNAQTVFKWSLLAAQRVPVLVSPADPMQK